MEISGVRTFTILKIMKKPNLEFLVKVDSRDAVKKLKEAHRITEDFSEAIHELVRDIQIGISVVPIKKKKRL